MMRHAYGSDLQTQRVLASHRFDRGVDDVNGRVPLVSGVIIVPSVVTATSVRPHCE